MKSSILLAAAAAALVGQAALAQKGIDAPPPLPAETPASEPSARPAQPPTNRRTVARLPESDRANGDAAIRAPAPATTATGEPPDDELLPPARHPGAPETLIEQKRQGNRVVEIVVTPKGTTSSYVIVNREGRQPLTTQELSSGLSTPRFLRFDF